MSTRLDLYLNELASEGSAQARGLFTLDQAEAIRKLREYQVAEPWEFVGALVASAVAAGSEWVRIERRRGEFSSGAQRLYDLPRAAGQSVF